MLSNLEKQNRSKKRIFFCFYQISPFFSYNLDYRSGWGWLQHVTNLTQTDLDKLSLLYTTAKNNNNKRYQETTPCGLCRLRERKSFKEGKTL